MEHQARADQLAQVPLFERCSKRELRRLARESHLEQVDAGQTLVTTGSPARQLYVILAGTAIVQRDGQTIGRLGRGEIVGELGVLCDAPRNADVLAETPSRYSAWTEPGCDARSTTSRAWAGSS